MPLQGLTPPKAGTPGSIANMTIPELITPTDGRRDKKGAVGIIPRMTLPTFARPNGGRVVHSPNTASSTGDGIKRQVTTRIFTFEGVPDPQAASSLLVRSSYLLQGVLSPAFFVVRPLTSPAWIKLLCGFFRGEWYGPTRIVQTGRTIDLMQQASDRPKLMPSVPQTSKSTKY